MRFEYLGIADNQQSDFNQTWQRQLELHELVSSARETNSVLFVQHSPVYTAGRRTEDHERPFDGTPVVEVNRGGKITYHGPGQLVGYPIVGLPEGVGVVDYVRRLEEAVIRVLAGYGLKVGRVAHRTGVWLPSDGLRPERKICAIGIRVSKRTTLHGFALNVAAAAAGPFANIIPCGIADAGVTTMEHELGAAPSLLEVAQCLEPHLDELLAFGPYTQSG